MSAYRESIITGGATSQKNCWMRRCQIIFESKYNVNDVLSKTDAERTYLERLEQKYPGLKTQGGIRYIVGDETGDNLSISINGTKQLGLDLDNGTVQISNMSYESLAKIMALKLFRITINVGYKNNDTLFTIAKGEISYIQQKIRTRRTVDVYITYASELVAAWSQSRINFSMRSGVNMYEMFNWMFLQQGCPTKRLGISPELKSLVAQNIYSASATTKDVITSALGSYGNTGQFLLTSDGSITNRVIDITNIAEKRIIKINKNIINLVNGNPQVTANGLNITLFPVVQFVPGDIIQVDNSLIDTSAGMTNQSGIQSTFNTAYVDPNGCYIIRQINYTFQNRGEDFTFKIQAIALNQYKNLIGV